MWQRLSDARGFTVIEVLVAASVLLVGLIGVVTMIDGANATSTTTKAREQGVNLARELVEAARSIPYSQLTPATVVPKVQAMPNLGNANLGPGWTIKRRGITYTVAMGACAVDDPADGYGVEDPNLFCGSNTGQPTTPCSTLLAAGITSTASLLNSLNGSLAGQLSIGDCGIDADLDGRIDNLAQADVALCALGACQNKPTTGDSTPDDYKRIGANVTWSVGTGSRYVLLATTEANPGQSGPNVSSLALSGLLSTPVIANLTSPITTNLIGVLGFSATADSTAKSMQWSVNGTPQGSATYNPVSGHWEFTWSIGSSVTGLGSETLDGNYTVSVMAFDQNGNAGPPLSTTVTLNRRQPYAPTNFAGGHDGSFVDFQWAPNKEGDIVGYQVYRAPGALQQDVLVCSTTNVHATSCQDTNPPLSPSIQYYVVAQDKDPNGNTRAGDHSSTLTVTTSTSTPNAPTNLQASTSNGNTVLAWSYTNGADPVDFFRIYRDGAAVANRYDTAPGNATTYTDTQTGGVAHTYRVTAVDSNLAESTAAGPVTR